LSATLERILETAIDGPLSKQGLPNISKLLESESSKVSSFGLESNIKSQPIQLGEPTKPEAPVFNIPEIKVPTPIVVLSQSESPVSGSSPISILQQTVNSLMPSGLANNSSVTSSETDTRNSLTNLLVNLYNETTNTVNRNRDSVESFVGGTTQNLINSTSLTAKSIMDSSVNSTNLTTKSIMDSAVNSINNTANSVNNSIGGQLRSTESISASLLKVPQLDTENKVTDRTSESFVKTNSIVDTNTVKRILEPDRTLERNVGQLTKVLPETINNLSTTVSSMSPSTSSSSTVMNEGNKIDQSTNTTIVKPETGSSQQSAQRPMSGNPQNQVDQSFYMEAIYQALMSGKVKVSLKY
jgi:hypothetical protein